MFAATEAAAAAAAAIAGVAAIEEEEQDDVTAVAVVVADAVAPGVATVVALALRPCRLFGRAAMLVLLLILRSLEGSIVLLRLQLMLLLLLLLKSLSYGYCYCIYSYYCCCSSYRCRQTCVIGIGPCSSKLSQRNFMYF